MPSKELLHTKPLNFSKLVILAMPHLLLGNTLSALCIQMGCDSTAIVNRLYSVLPKSNTWGAGWAANMTQQLVVFYHCMQEHNPLSLYSHLCILLKLEN